LDFSAVSAAAPIPAIIIFFKSSPKLFAIFITPF
jgi:hypothetical protein